MIPLSNVGEGSEELHDSR